MYVVQGEVVGTVEEGEREATSSSRLPVTAMNRLCVSSTLCVLRCVCAVTSNSLPNGVLRIDERMCVCVCVCVCVSVCVSVCVRERERGREGGRGRGRERESAVLVCPLLMDCQVLVGLAVVQEHSSICLYTQQEREKQYTCSVHIICSGRTP